MIKTTVGVDGMACGMCEAHIADTVRKVYPKAKKVNASQRKKSVTFLTEEEPDAAVLQKAIDATGYRFISIASEPVQKRGLFS